MFIVLLYSPHFFWPRFSAAACNSLFPCTQKTCPEPLIQTALPWTTRTMIILELKTIITKMCCLQSSCPFHQNRQTSVVDILNNILLHFFFALWSFWTTPWITGILPLPCPTNILSPSWRHRMANIVVSLPLEKHSKEFDAMVSVRHSSCTWILYSEVSWMVQWWRGYGPLESRTLDKVWRRGGQLEVSPFSINFSFLYLYLVIVKTAIS